MIATEPHYSMGDLAERFFPPELLVEGITVANTFLERDEPVLGDLQWLSHRKHGERRATSATWRLVIVGELVSFLGGDGSTLIDRATLEVTVPAGVHMRMRLQRHLERWDVVEIDLPDPWRP